MVALWQGLAQGSHTCQGYGEDVCPLVEVDIRKPPLPGIRGKTVALWQGLEHGNYNSQGYDEVGCPLVVVSTRKPPLPGIG